MRILVLLGIGADVRVSVERDPRSGRVRAERLVREIDPDCGRALDLALRLKCAHPGTELTALHFGPPSGESRLRHALAQGVDRAVRIWDEEVTGARAGGKAVILAAAAEAAGFDLILAGATGVVEAGGQLGVLVAAHLGVPCVTQVVDMAAAEGPDASAGRQSLEMMRGLDRGFRERVLVSLPVVATVSSLGAAPVTTAKTLDTTHTAVTARALLAVQDQEIATWDLADLGVPLDGVRRADGSLVYGRPRPRRPRLRPLAAPDPALPAFDRILKLIEGSVKRREGRVVRRSADAIVDEIFRLLHDEGWLDHLRPGAQRVRLAAPGDDRETPEPGDGR